MKTCRIDPIKRSLHGGLQASEYALIDSSNGPFKRGMAYIVGWGLRALFFGVETFEIGAKGACAAQAAGYYAACVADGGKRLPSGTESVR